MTKLQEHLVELRKELELEKPFPTEDDENYLFRADIDVEIWMRELESGVIELKCAIGELPSNDLEGFFEAVMVGNLFGIATDGATLGVDPEGKKLTILLEIEQDSGYDYFRDHLEDFLNTIDRWKEQIENHKQGKQILSKR